MAQVKSIENKIRRIEGFEVRLRWNNRDVRADCGGLPPYPPYERMANDDTTVSAWKRARFAPYYPGYHVDVLDGEGDPCPGNMKLATVRAGYN